MYQHRKERLLQLIDQRYDGLRKRVCDASGWSEARLSQLLSNTYREGRAFSEKTARKLEEDLQLEPLYFDRETDAANDSATLRGVMQVEVTDDNSADFVQVPLIKLRLSAGLTGFQADPEYHDGSKMSLPRQWVNEKRLSPRSLIALKVKGDSMIPNLYEGDTVIVNTADRKMVDGAVFAVNFEGEAVIKRLERRGGMWYLASDNTLLPQYKPRLVRDNEAIIVGRVVRRETDQI